MSEFYRYRLQRKEPYAMPNILGGHSMPVHTYRWVDVAATINLKRAIFLLESYSPEEREIHRIEDIKTGRIYK